MLYQGNIRRSYAFDQFMSRQRLRRPGQHGPTGLRQAISPVPTGWLHQIEAFFTHAMSAKYFDQAGDGLLENCHSLDDCFTFSHQPAQFAVRQLNHLSSSSNIRKYHGHMIEWFQAWRNVLVRREKFHGKNRHASIRRIHSPGRMIDERAGGPEFQDRLQGKSAT
jgi:hypothetical protein